MAALGLRQATRELGLFSVELHVALIAPGSPSATQSRIFKTKNTQLQHRTILQEIQLSVHRQICPIPPENSRDRHLSARETSDRL
ncbi:hypothetical protein EYF80_063220 [Liparis tanakae]|uniref:Uncharacterized protein n=1 Tax=Liparis tanakae TaxID=230148 RepID=A0A4Z2EDS4_9TELE|nr:hypothetical protein EYF80_063220 [Liparis tanakae]